MKGHTVADAGVLSRAQGCLLGQIAGDSLGSLVEFMSADQIARSYPDGVRELKSGGTWGTIAGQCTDDSELALALARTLAVRGTYDENAIARAYGEWYGSRPFDIGTTTSQAFSAAARARSKHAAASRKAASRSSQSNGALMRISPLGIFGWSLPTEKLAELARRDAQLSHPHQVCQDASAVLVVAIQHALKTGDDGAKVYGFVLDWSKKQGICHDFFQSMVDAEKEPPIDFQLHMGWCRTALRNAFFQLLHAKSFEAGVVDTVARGGDTDTNGAIAGALLGALHGVDAVPFQWRDRVLTCRPLAGIPGVNRPRPAVYWPTDALELAEQLLSVGHREVRQSR
jgi:ADP-ribosylglycohydrolase